MCRENGTIVDDLLVYRLPDDRILFVVNAANIEKDFEFIKEHSKDFEVKLENLSDSYAQIAVQGPKSPHVIQKLVDINIDDLAYYHSVYVKIAGEKVILSRTGYTGEDGFEIYSSNEEAPKIWQLLLENGKNFGIMACGLGARDTLRFEAKLMLYGNELDDNTNPLEARLGWTVKFHKPAFIGKEALLKQKQDPFRKKLAGFEMLDKAVPRSYYKVFNELKEEIGYVTSGTYAPFLRKNLGLCYVKPAYAKRNTIIYVEVRGKLKKAQIVKTPFYKKPEIEKVNFKKEKEVD